MTAIGIHPQDNLCDNRRRSINGTQVLALGLGLAPWFLKDQHLGTPVSPCRLDLYGEAERGSLFPCPECDKACPAQDFADNKTWRHLNYCYLHARVPSTKSPEHGIKCTRCLGLVLELLHLVVQADGHIARQRDADAGCLPAVEDFR